VTPADRAGRVDDAALVEAARRGDRHSLNQLLQLHFDRIRALCRRVMANDADTDDATQEALIAICRGIVRFDGRSSFSTWLYRVTTNACLDELRRKSRRPVAMARDELPLPAHTDGFAEEVADRMALDAALAQLGADFRVAVVLRDVCRLDYEEISEVLAIPPGTVRSRIARGRAQLARILGPPAERGTGPERPFERGTGPERPFAREVRDHPSGGNQPTGADRPKQSE
jgi:RNA polymerase sigma-70 factor (ECF subfamily)